VQLQGVVVTLVWSVGVTAALFYGLKAVMRMRVKPEAEIEGLDMAAHGERGYHST
jgi:Amt family ammonium transporter